MFLAEKRRIASSFGAEVAAIYHIGSTAVPGLSAKPEIEVSNIATRPHEITRCAPWDMFVGQTFQKDITSIAGMSKECGRIRCMSA
ncbi:GrpB family protein [Rhizobium tibeticum]|uniref:GrpB family protein n=1 Tax=Rhizobium tibeticum TaxID=501024 RepID=UPI0027D8135F|nr:GrpB family protein [Rhizobium tibeticum]